MTAAVVIASIVKLIRCLRLSRRFHALTLDSELWKRQYYSRWVWPRARRLAHITTSSLRVPTYSPRVSNWLDHGHLASDGRPTNWKRQYRLRHNWSKGVCRVRELELPQSTFPPTLVNLCHGVVFTADSELGLRAWICQREQSCVGSASFREPSVPPTALSASHDAERSWIEVVVGFKNGSFDIYTFDLGSSQSRLAFSHDGEADGAITAIASSSCYVLMVSRHKLLTLYETERVSRPNSSEGPIDGIRSLATLRADNIVAPLSLSIRIAASEIVASIVYSFYHLGCGWSLGIQELRFSAEGDPVGSRLATTVDSQYGKRQLDPAAPLSAETGRGKDSEETTSSSATPCILHQNPPTSMSYSHPYLLTSHGDNTLTMYLVVSTAERLFVKVGKRLWGHTSSVSAVQVSDRGKAVSVSARGDEIRIWELEKTLSTSRPKDAMRWESSIKVSPDNKLAPGRSDAMTEQLPRDTRSVLKDVGSQELPHEIVQTRGCVGFNDEVVLLLRERELGRQLLECYDFT